MIISQASQCPPPPVYSTLSQTRIKVFSPGSTCQPGELGTNAGIDETSTILADLAIIVAYNKVLIREKAASGNAVQGSINAAPGSDSSAPTEKSTLCSPLSGCGMKIS